MLLRLIRSARRGNWRRPRDRVGLCGGRRLICPAPTFHLSGCTTISSRTTLLMSAVSSGRCRAWPGVDAICHRCGSPAGSPPIFLLLRRADNKRPRDFSSFRSRHFPRSAAWRLHNQILTAAGPKRRPTNSSSIGIFLFFLFFCDGGGNEFRLIFRLVYFVIFIHNRRHGPLWRWWRTGPLRRRQTNDTARNSSSLKRCQTFGRDFVVFKF